MCPIRIWSCTRWHFRVNYFLWPVVIKQCPWLLLCVCYCDAMACDLVKLCDWLLVFNSLRPRQNGRHFADDIFKCIFLNENVRISINISLKCVPKGPIDHIPALVQIMAWRRPVMISLPTHICVTRPQWVNTLRPRQNGRHFADDTFKCIFLNENVITSTKISLKFVPKCSINNIPTLVQIMAWRRPGDKPLSEPMMVRLSTHICVTRPQWVNNISALVQPKSHYLSPKPVSLPTHICVTRPQWVNACVCMNVCDNIHVHQQYSLKRIYLATVLQYSTKGAYIPISTVPPFTYFSEWSKHQLHVEYGFHIW